MIPVPESSVLQAIDVPQYSLSLFSRFLVTKDNKLLFNLELALVKNVIKRNDGRNSVLPEKLPNGVYNTPLDIMAVVSCDILITLILNNKLFPFIVQDKWCIQNTLHTGGVILPVLTDILGKRQIVIPDPLEYNHPKEF
jgi:hypothetical protein